jgi:glycosyltransferase involved in cell wall biosynthesis
MVDITVIVLAHDRTEYIVGALRSLLRQTLPRDSFEVVIVKNFVLEEADRLAAECGFKSILAESKAYGENLLKGLNNSSGEFVCLLDEDDLFVPKKLETVLGEFSKHPRVGYYSNNFGIIDSKGGYRPEHWFRRADRKARVRAGTIYLGPPHQLRQLAKLPPLSPDFNSSSITFRRDLLTTAMRDAIRKLDGGGDTFLFYCAVTSKLELGIGSDILTLYRLHSANRSSGLGPPGSGGWIRIHQYHTNRSVQWSMLANELFDACDDPSVGRSVRALAAYHAFYAAEMDASPARKRILESASRLTQFRDTYTAQVAPNVLLPTLLYLTSPRIAQWFSFIRQALR